MSTFWKAFSSTSDDDNQTKPPLDIHLCRGCFDVMWSAAVSSQSMYQKRNQPQQSNSSINPTAILQKFNELPSAPVRFVMVEEQRSIRRTPYTREELSSSSSSTKTTTTSALCDACLGSLQHIDTAILEVVSAVTRSPFKDSNEISFSCSVPPALCLWWDCIVGLLVECVHRCASTQVSHRLVGGAFMVNDESGDYFWRGNLREDQISGGLRGALVADVRTICLQCLPPPPPQPGAPSSGEQPAWRYQTPGSGQGIVAHVLFHNSDVWVPTSLPAGAQLAAVVQSGNLGAATGCLAAASSDVAPPTSSSSSSSATVDPLLLQHDSASLQWTRLVDEICPIMRKRLSASPAPLSLTACSVGVQHEPLFLYGRYRKFSRTMSQSPWFAGGGSVRIGQELSLQEEVTNRLLHIFFPGCDIATLNAEAALYDGRLVVSSWGQKPGKDDKNKNNDNNGEQQQQQQRSHHMRKEEAQQVRREAAAEAASSSSNVPPQRRERNDDDKDGDSKIEKQQPAAAAAAAAAAAGNNSGGGNINNDPFRFVSAHVRPMFDNVQGFCLYRFHAGGREDVDVRMLGNGRPFVVEVNSPHRQFFSEAELGEVARLVSDTSEAIEIDSLQIVPRTIMGDLQKDAEAKRKAYRCVCYSKRPLRADDPVFARIQAQLPITLKQKTPIRVLHRRSSMTRERKIYSADIELLNQHWMIVDLVTQAGTYVKEFCHGDLGRTLPNLGTLLESDFTDIIQLDVKHLFSTLNVGEDGGGDGQDDDDDDVGGE